MLRDRLTRSADPLDTVILALPPQNLRALKIGVSGAEGWTSCGIVEGDADESLLLSLPGES